MRKEKPWARSGEPMASYSAAKFQNHAIEGIARIEKSDIQHPGYGRSVRSTARI
jgi:hypothetical protein